MKLSLAITTYNRYELTKESFAQVIDDPRIDDIVILDDASTDGSYEKLKKYFEGHEKVRVIRQAQNRGMAQNKADAVALSKAEWVILWDSDNVIGPSYLDAILMGNTTYDDTRQFYRDTIYVPEYARPQFDYRRFAGKSFNKHNAVDLINDDMGRCLLNTCNYVVNRDMYADVFKNNPEIKGTDTLWFNYLWLSRGYNFYVVPGMQYFHLVHDGSTWKEHADYNMKKANELNRKILAL